MSEAPRVVVVGAGGIGHPCAMALAHEPIALTVIDDDRVDVSNLHRLARAQERDVGVPKIELIERVRRATPHADRDRYIADRFTPDTAITLLEGAALVIDATDNYATRFLVADACGLRGVASVHGAAVGWIGTVMTVIPDRAACYRCVFEDLPGGDALDCATAGVFGPVTSLIGALMAGDAMRFLRGDLRHAGHVTRYDGWTNQVRATRLARRADCPLCGTTRTIHDLDPARYALAACASAPSEGSPTMSIVVRIPTPLRSLTQGKEEVQATGATVSDVIADLEAHYPGMRDRLLDDKGVRRFINLYLNEDDVRFLDALKTTVKAGDTLTIVPAIAGG